MEVFASPTALTFICLLLAILLITLATLIIFSCRRKQLPLFLLGPKKWSKAATKVVRETNLLYPWASPPHHNCSHLQTKEAMNAAASALFGNRTPGVGRNLQVGVMEWMWLFLDFFTSVQNKVPSFACLRVFEYVIFGKTVDCMLKLIKLKGSGQVKFHLLPISFRES